MKPVPPNVANDPNSAMLVANTITIKAIGFVNTTVKATVEIKPSRGIKLT